MHALTREVQELVEPKSVEEDSAKQSWTAAPREGRSDSLRHEFALPLPARLRSLLRRSPERRAEEFVFLVVRKTATAPWQFPACEHRPGETIREARLSAGSRQRHAHPSSQAGVRALAESAEGVEAHFVGNSPACHHTGANGRTTFFMRACYLGGDLKPHALNGFAGACAAPVLSRNALLSADSDWAWVTKAEVPDFLEPQLHEVMARAL